MHVHNYKLLKNIQFSLRLKQKEALNSCTCDGNLRKKQKKFYFSLIMNIMKMIDGKIQDFKFLSNLPIFHSSICWFNNEGFVFLSFFQFSTIALKCSISDTVRMGSKLRKVLHFNVITLMWSYDEKKKSWCFFF